MNKELKLIYELAEGSPIYLVGGFVRDYFLGVESRDLDFVVFGDSQNLAKVFARKIKGAFVVLDEAEQSFRVVKDDISFDFTKNRAETLKEDLKARDFTINALAMELNNTEIIDEIGGVADLNAKIVRAISEQAFLDDPLRLLRAFRIAAKYKFTIDPETLKLIKKHANLIVKPSEERIHDELSKFFSYLDIFDYLIAFDNSDLLAAIFDDVSFMKKHNEHYFHKLGLWGHSLETLFCLEFILKNLDKLFTDEEIALFGTDFRNLKIACLFHDLGKPETFSKFEDKIHFIKHDIVGEYRVKAMLKKMKFSKKEIKFIAGIAFFHMQAGNLAKLNEITQKASFRFFKRTEKLALPLILFTMSDWLASIRGVKNIDYSQGISIKEFKYPDFVQCLKSAKTLLAWYLEKLNKKEIKLFLNGYDLMEKFDLIPSKLFGKILADLEEAQMTEKVKTKKQAYKFVEEILANNRS